MNILENVTTFTELLAFLYAILMLVGYIPGLYSLIKEKDLVGVSNNFWFLVIVTVGITFQNLILTGATEFQIWSVGLNLGLGVICFLITITKKSGFDGFIWGLLLLIAIYSFCHIFRDSNVFLQNIAHISITLAYIGQIYNYRKQKTITGTNIWLFVIMGTGLLCLIVSMIISGAFLHAIITEALNFILILVCFLQAKYYQRG